MTTTRLSSWLLLGGILLGFLGSVWQGHLASAYSKPDHFKRFHQRISPDASFYPPFAMMETLALARWRAGQTLVIIGGNSILNGVGQPEDELWTQRLQELLGDSYVVVNLAIRGVYPTQAAAVVAESLVRRGLPVLFVANTSPPAGTGRAPGGANGYYYWQALYQHQLVAYPPREQDIRTWLDSLPPVERQQQAEERLAARLEAWCRPQSLWHHVGYRHFFTVWNFILAGDSFRPRVGFPDNEPSAPPLEDRFQNALPQEMAIVRGFSETLAMTGPDGQLQFEPGNRQRLVTDIETAIVPLLRPHTLMLLSESAPYYLEQLTPAERTKDAFVYAACAQIWREQGIACEVAGKDFDFADYIDRSHLSSEGGNKLAKLVARKLIQLNHP